MGKFIIRLDACPTMDKKVDKIEKILNELNIKL